MSAIEEKIDVVLFKAQTLAEFFRMDKHAAEKLKADLLGKPVGGWSVEEYINHGKSAAVFKAVKGSQMAALKVFDPELVDRYGRDNQRKRIERERSLVGKHHPNLVQIYDGGEDGEYLYVAMEYFPGKNLAEVLKDIPEREIRPLIAQIASAAKFLEDAAYAHRDIKPENIGISKDMKHAKLLDLGVVRPFDLSNVTDEGEQRFFVGTLQYSPPELLFCEEEQSLEGWRAITFYQLGGVLHDLLTREPLFKKFKNPYGRLVRAVEREIPLIAAKDTNADLRLLAQNCLAKNPGHRLSTVRWDDFNPPQEADSLDAVRRRIAHHRTLAAQMPVAPANMEEQIAQQAFTLRTAIHSAVVNIIKTENLPRYSAKVAKKSQPYLLRVVFESSAKHGLKGWFAFYCQGTVVEPASSLHELVFCACVGSNRESIPVEPVRHASTLVLKGQIIEQDVRNHIQKCLLLAYAEALDEDAGALKSVRWLKLGGSS